MDISSMFSVIIQQGILCTINYQNFGLYLQWLFETFVMKTSNFLASMANFLCQLGVQAPSEFSIVHQVCLNVFMNSLSLCSQFFLTQKVSFYTAEKILKYSGLHFIRVCLPCNGCIMLKYLDRNITENHGQRFTAREQWYHSKQNRQLATSFF